ncbi:MAG: hypothetical protein FWD94_05380 [Treponema sp.]|nr:hypothetical protein [Treponema sp.]
MTEDLLSLAIFSSLSLNLVLHLGLGIRELTEIGAKDGDSLPPKAEAPSSWRKAGLGSVVAAGLAMLLWFVLAVLRFLLPLGSLEYLLVFPLALALCRLWDCLVARHLPRTAAVWKLGGPTMLADGIPVAAAVFVMLALARSFLDSAVLALGFSAGSLLAVICLAEIRNRARIHAVQDKMRGIPLTLVAMGLLSLILTLTSGVLFRMMH